MLTISDVSELKKEVREKFSREVHFHDCCGGNYFHLDANDEEMKEFIVQFFSKKNQRVVFSADGLSFRVG